MLPPYVLTSVCDNSKKLSLISFQTWHMHVFKPGEEPCFYGDLKIPIIN